MFLLAWFSPQDMLIIGVIALLLFGNRLPSVMRSLGQGVTEFKKGLEGGPDNDSTKSLEPPRRTDAPNVNETPGKLDQHVVNG